MKSVDLHPQAHIFLLYKRRQLRRSIGGKRETTYGTGARIAPSTRGMTTSRSITQAASARRSASSARSAGSGRRSGRAVDESVYSLGKLFRVFRAYACCGSNWRVFCK
jgi:hypothetical protein